MLPSFTDILNISRTGMQSRLQDLDIISNNLANVNTTAYKSNRGNFQELFDNVVSKEKGVLLQSTQRDFSEGTYEESDNSLHLAIKGAGFFAVTLPNNTKAYTRDGLFQLDANRRIVNADGFPLVWSGTIPEGTEKIEIDELGKVTVLQNGKWTNVGTIQLNRFPNPNGLTAEGNNLFLQSDTSGAVQPADAGSNSLGTILARMRETSNVSLSDEMTDAMITQRGFQLSLRTFQQTDTMLGLALGLRR